MLDTVHDVQTAYRRLLTAFSFPGMPQRLFAGMPPDDQAHEGSSATTLLAMTLLDNEVSAFFHHASPAEPERLRHLTYTRMASPDTADFLFLALEPDTEAFRHANVGTHIDPHLGATILVYVPMLPSTTGDSVAGSARPGYVLTGPGIADERRLTHDLGASAGRRESESYPLWWVEARNELCAEYPLGVEVVLYDAETNVIAVPRSTRIVNVPSNGSRGGA